MRPSSGMTMTAMSPDNSNFQLMLAILLGLSIDFCFQPQVSQLKGSGINDKCLDMQKSAGKKKTPEELEGVFASF
jgi:hypothetical protein